MRERIPGIIRQTSASIASIPAAEKQAYAALAKCIGENGPVEDRTDSSLLGELFRVKLARSCRKGLHWHAISWWLAENYEYFLLDALHTSLKQADQPEDLFWYLKKRGLDGALPLFADCAQLLVDTAGQTTTLTLELFRLALLRNLWGNKADLSMSGGVVSQKELKSDSSNLLLLDDIDAVYAYYCSHNITAITIMADNTGFEVLCDFLLAALLLHFNPLLRITYVVKAAPVFVSDVTLSDIDITLSTMAAFSKDGSVSSLALQWIASTLQEARQAGRFVPVASTFLCTADPGWNMPLSLAELLGKQNLLISKGDANYRRLLGDLHWPYDTALKDVLGYLPCAVLVMRTMKSNVNIGISKALQTQATQFDTKWDCSGKVGMIQFYHWRVCNNHNNCKTHTRSPPSSPPSCTPSPSPSSGSRIGCDELPADPPPGRSTRYQRN